MLLRIEDVICDIPRGSITKLAIDRYKPAFAFLYKNKQIGVPNAKKLERNMLEKIIVVLIEKLIFDLKTFMSFGETLSISFDCSLIDGIIVTAKALIRVVGIIIIGKVMPIIIPNSDRASVAVYPKACNLIGMITAMIDETTDETVRTAVIGELVFSNFLNSCFGFDKPPPVLLYIKITIIEDITHAALRESAVLFVGEIFRYDI